MEKLTVILIVRNEEAKIRRCLDSVKWADEVVVLDQSSTDRTVSICKEYTDKVFVVPAKGFCEPDREPAASKAGNNWILYIDADEEIPFGLREEIKAVLSGNPQYNCYYIPRKNIFLGKWIKESDWYPAHVPRLFKKGSVKFPEEIHKDILPVGSYGYLKNDIIHHTYENIEEYFRKFNRYTTIMARQMHQRGERITALNFILKLLIMPPAFFLYRFIFKAGFRDGLYGLIIASSLAITVFIANIKLREIANARAKTG